MVGTFKVTILLLAGSGSLAVMTLPAMETGVPVIWNVCPDVVGTVVTVPGDAGIECRFIEACWQNPHPPSTQHNNIINTNQTDPQVKGAHVLLHKYQKQLKHYL